MAVGDRYRLGDVEFIETFHGPMVWGPCVGCGRSVMVVGRTGRIGAGGLEEDTGSTAQARCSSCGRAHHGADLTYYGTGRALLLPRTRRHMFNTKPGSCRWCHGYAYTADAEGPVHPCCQTWRGVISAGGKCPACGESRAAAREWARRLEQRRKAVEAQRRWQR
jgi:hypothetical protein